MLPVHSQGLVRADGYSLPDRLVLLCCYHLTKTVRTVSGKQLLAVFSARTFTIIISHSCSNCNSIFNNHENQLQAKKRKQNLFPFQMISLCFSDFLITFGCSITSPCISHRYCSGVSCFASCSFLDHWNAPLSSRLYNNKNPSPSHSSAFIRSHLLQNRNKLPEQGSSP